LPRHIPSFSTVMWGQLGAEHSLDSGIETARTVMNRRGQLLTVNAERLLRIIYERTAAERQMATQRSVDRLKTPN